MEIIAIHKLPKKTTNIADALNTPYKYNFNL